MKLYAIAMLLAFAYAQEEETTAEEPVAEEETADEPAPYTQDKADLVYATDGDWAAVSESNTDNGFSTGVPSEAKGAAAGVKSSY